MFENVVLSVDDCHCIVPLLPLSVNIVLFVPVHTVPAPLIVPATLIELTVAVTLLEVDNAQAPFVTEVR